MKKGLFQPSPDPDRFGMGVKALGISDGLYRITDHFQTFTGDHLDGCCFAEVLDIEP